MSEEGMDDLQAELERGRTAAVALIQHVENMGAAETEMPIATDRGMWVITVKRLGIAGDTSGHVPQ